MLVYLFADTPGLTSMEPVTPGKQPRNSSPSGAQTIHWMGLDFEPMQTRLAVTRLMERTLGDDEFCYVVTPNVDHMLRLDTSPGFRETYAEAGLVLNDSRVLETLAARDNIDLPASPGADVVAGLLDLLPRSAPVSVIGTAPDQISALWQRYGFEKIYHHQPPMGLRNNPEAIVEAAAFMAEHPALVHFICVGSPQQEMVALAAKLRGDVKGIGLCCGASIDFLTGKADRAPNWVRQARLEWLHRLLSEPRRMFRRYLIDGPRIFRLWSRYRKADKIGNGPSHLSL